MSFPPPDAAIDPRVALTRERVLAAVEKLLRAGGVTEVTHSAVARTAGVGRATVYRHWPRLDDLLADAVESHMGITGLAFTGDALADLRMILRTISAAVLTDTGGALFMALLSQGSETSQLAGLRQEVMVRRLGAIRNLIAQGIDQGTVDPTLDPDDAVSLLFGPLVHRRVILGKPIDDAFIDEVVRRATTPAT